MSHFVATLKEVLLERKVTLRELSNKTSIPLRTLYDMGKFNPTIPNALKIVDYFSSSLDYFENKNSIFICSYNKLYTVEFYKNLIKELKIKKISQAKLCRDVGISESCFKRWKRGVLPTYENLIAIAIYLDCSIDELIGRNYLLSNN